MILENDYLNAIYYLFTMRGWEGSWGKLHSSGQSWGQWPARGTPHRAKRWGRWGLGCFNKKKRKKTDEMRRDGEDSLQMAAAARPSPFQLSPVLGGHKSPALCLPVSLFYRASELPVAFQSLGCCSLTFIGPLGTNMHQNPAAILPIDGLQRHYLSKLCCTFLPQSLL